MANILMSTSAERDLEQIGDYIAKQLKSPKTALNTVKKIRTSIDKLADFPLIGTPLASIIAIESNYRFIGCGNYLAFYRVQGNDVFIDRIIHGRRDYVTILFGELPKGD